MNIPKASDCERNPVSTRTHAPTPRQALNRAVIDGDHAAALSAIAVGAEPMALLVAAIEGGFSYVDFLVQFIDSDRKPEMISVSEHLKRHSKYPRALKTLEDWIATH